MSYEILFTTFIAATIILLFVILNVCLRKSSKNSNQSEQSNNLDDDEVKDENQSKPVQNKPKPQKVPAKSQKIKEVVFKHEWLSSILKAHSDNITGIDFSPNGKYLISSGIDRAIFLWNTKEFEQSQHKTTRCNVEFDHAIKVRFCPDSRSFITSLGVSNTVRVFKIIKKDDNSLQIVQASTVPDFPTKHEADIINIGISCNAKFIMTCSKDTAIYIRDIKGELLGYVDTRLMKNSYGAVSLCGRFFGACGFTPDVKVWEVCFDKQGNFREIRRAFELKGHTAGIYNFSYNSDTTRMATVSKDQTWKLWNTNVDYEKGQDPTVLVTGNVELIGHSLIALSPNSYSVAIAVENNLCFYNAMNGKCDEKIDKVCHDAITEISFSTDNKYLAVAGDRHIKIFHNITGFKAAIDIFTENLKSAKTQSAKERFQETIDEYRNLLNKVK